MNDLLAQLVLFQETIIVCAMFWLFCAAVTAFLAANRGLDSFKWFAVGLLIGPFAFWVVLRSASNVKGNMNESVAKRKA
ncbi:MAG: hypothetical protein CSYNP_02159 [Syntrophus sp. SKADARSKE-3]|nr:hypothetical protein [Syntrophus sp. SKADARSKE-3]